MFAFVFLLFLLTTEIFKRASSFKTSVLPIVILDSVDGVVISDRFKREGDGR